MTRNSSWRWRVCPLSDNARSPSHFAGGSWTSSHDARVKVPPWSPPGGADITEAELQLAAHAAHAARVDSFAQCGSDASWTAQSGHFVAKAAQACVRIAVPGESIAWDAAMQARLARTCQTVAEGLGTENTDAREQYRILETFLQR
jgi:hypothetical protein